MFLKTLFIFTLLISSRPLFAYELPKVEIPKEQRPSITLFKAESIVEENAKKYKLIWKTEHATHVQLTFFGNVQPSGSLIITEKEYQQGPITLTATSTKNSFSDSQTINKFIKADREAPLIIRKESKEIYEEYYSTPIPARIPPRRQIPPRRIRPY